MSMNENDTFIREVNEDIRSDQFRAIWRRFGTFLIAAVVAIIVGVAGSQGYQYWQKSQASVSGDRFLAALKDIEQKKPDEAQKALEALQQDGFGSYPILARMRLATLQAEKGDTAAAISAFSEIGKDQSIPEALRNVAKLRAAYLLVDAGTYEQVSAEAEILTGPTSASRHSAREVLGLSAYKAGDFAKARDWFQLIVDDTEAPGNISTRARMMLDLIIASGKAA